jgi:hypothetical protein
MKKNTIYLVRYFIEKWNKPIEEKGPVENVAPGIKIVSPSYGYVDQLFVASIMKDEDGEIESILLLDSEAGKAPSRTTLLAVKEAIEHQLKYHCEKN